MDMGFRIHTKQHGWRLMGFIRLPWDLENTSWELALMPVLYNNSPIIIHKHLHVAYTESASWELALMPILYNNNPILNHSHSYNSSRPRNYRLARGYTHFPRILCLTWGNTHLPRTSPEENTHFPRTSHSHQGFGSLPNSRPGIGKLPTWQLQPSLRSTSLVLLYTQLIHEHP